MKKMYFVYLCGGMGKFGRKKFNECNEWRKHCKQVLENCESDYKIIAVNPNDYFNFVDKPPRYKTQNEVMKFDLHKLRNSNLIIANFNDKYSLGSMSEIAIAYDRGIPIIGLNESNQKLHPWQTCMRERIFDDIDEMLDYIQDFYLI